MDSEIEHVSALNQLLEFLSCSWADSFSLDLAQPDCHDRTH